MALVVARVRRFLICEDGPTAIEYALMLALLIVVCMNIVTLLGRGASSTFSKVNGSLS